MGTKPTCEALEQRVRELEMGVGNERADHLNRVLRAIRNINQLITRETDRDRLLQGACDSLIETREYYNAWIALFDESGGVTATAKAGLGKDFMTLVERMTHGDLTACGRKALSETGVVTTLDPASACADCPLSASYDDRGAMTIRLEHKGKVYGLLSASIPSHFVGDAEEQGLFREMAGDIAFALRAIEEREGRKRADEALRESEERMALALRGADLGTWDWNVRTNEVQFDPRWAEMLGCALEEIKPHLSTWEKLVHPDDLPRAQEILNAHLEGKTPCYEAEFRMRHKSGDWVWILDKGKVIERDADGHPLRACGTHLDITQRKRYEEELKRLSHMQAERIKELRCTNAVVDAVRRLKDLKEIAKTVVCAMPSGFQYPEIATARIVYDGEAFVSGPFEESDWCLSKVFAMGEKPGIVEVFYTEERPPADEGPFLKEERDLIDSITHLLDEAAKREQARSEKAELEQQLLHAQKMEAIGTLAGGIAHDFNNILAAITGYTQLLMMKLPKGSDIRPDLDEVLQASRRARDLIQQILTFSRERDEEKIPIEMIHLVKETLKFLRSSLPSSIEFREKLSERVGIIHANPTQIHQVIMNLCTNAAHAMQEAGGVLEVELRNAELGLRPIGAYAPEGTRNAELNLGPGRYLRLTVSDTGCGMTPEIVKKIFDPYFTTKEKGVGTGLGLSVVHGIVMGHGGAVAVESEPGKGSAFHVYFPLVQEVEEAKKAVAETPLPRGSEIILFVDDEPSLARLGKRFLTRLGYDVVSTTSSIDALGLVRKDPHQFDLVITDTTMPAMTGDRLTQEILKIRPDMPIIISTGHSERISPEKAKKMGIKAFLMKPLEMGELAETVRKVLDEK